MESKPTYEELEVRVEKRTAELKKELEERRQTQERIEGLNRLKEDLLGPGSLTEKMKRITDGVVDILGADFARIWLTNPGDMCDSGCMHAQVREGPHVCRERNRCLHLVAGSGRYTHMDGAHGRVPFGRYKIGRVAAADEPGFLTNDVTHDPRVHNHEWARELGLVSFAGYRLVSHEGAPIGVLALFSKQAFSPSEEALLQTIAGTASEVVQTSRSVDALRKSEEKLRTIIEHSNELFYIHDTEHTLTYASQTSVDLLGYTPEEMMMKWTELATDNPINQKGLEVTEKGIATGEKQAPYLLELAKKDGTSVWLEIDESPVKDASGKAVAIAGAARDVTEQKRTEQRLLKSEKGFRDLFDSITDLIYTQDLDGRFINVNRGMCNVFGYERDELIGRPASDFMEPKMRPFFETGYLEPIKTKGRQEGITSYFAKNGDKIYIDYHSSLIDPDDGAPHISGTGRDVTGQVLSRREIKRLQNQVYQSQKMEAIGTLAGGVAHDLNNILGGLVSYPELLLMQMPDDSPLRKPILTIQKSGEKAAAVVQDLLTLARRGVVVTEVVDLNDVIAQYLKSPEHENLQSYHPGVHIETRLDADTLNILGSSTHLSKTVMNLVSNAAEAMPGGGALTVSTENRYIDRPVRGYDDVKEGDYVVLSVSDTGTGISSDDLEKIFEPFYTKKRMGRSGTGLGMAVVWGTVKDHNGYIHAQSTEGKGTAFTLYFPVTRKSVEKRSEISPREFMGKGEAILVVDDVAEQRKIASGMLKELGYSVVSVSSGEEAVEYLRSNKVDLLVLDMIMDPGMDGLDTYRKIIEIHPGQKAVIGSGFSETDRAKKLQRLGAGAYIRKPFLLEKIGIAVKEELAK